MLGALFAALINALAALFKGAIGPLVDRPEPEEPGGEEPAGVLFVTDTSRQITTHFNASEFVCIDKSEPFRISLRLVEGLEGFRARIGGPLRVNSGFRTRAHNARIGGVPNSYHTKGMAADLGNPSGMAVTEFHRRARAYWLDTGRGGLGLYPWGVHVDIGPSKVWREGIS